MSLKLTAVSLLLASVTFAAAPPPATVVKEVTGEAAIVDGNRDKAFAEAKSAALRDAVEQVAGVLVSADTLTANSQLISDRILMHSAGYVRTHEVLERKEEGGVAKVKVRAEVGTALAEAKPDLEVPAGTRMVGVAGTVTQLAAINAGVAVYDPDLTHHAILSHGDVRRVARRLAILPYEQRKKVKALVPGRADVIVAGAEILLSVMEAFDTPEVLTSEKDILDGLVMELLTGDLPG